MSKANDKRIGALYESLTSKEKASLTMRHAADMNGAEIKRIRGTVPWETYRCIDAKYAAWIDCFNFIASLWGLCWWKELAAHTHALLVAVNCGTGAEQRPHLDQGLARLAALLAALDAFCQEHGLDAGAMRKLACLESVPSIEQEPDADYVQEMLGHLRECVPKHA